MRRVVVLTLLALALPIVAWAGTLDITNEFGSVSVTNAGIVVGGIAIFAPDEMGHLRTGKLGLGHLLDRRSHQRLDHRDRWRNVCGRRIISREWRRRLGKNINGASTCGSGYTLFTGSFVGPVTWTWVSSKGLGSVYMLSGTVTGTLYDGRTVTGMTKQNILCN